MDISNRLNRSKYWDTMCALLDAQFPKKQCKERGRAIVMLSYIEMMLQGFKFDENGKPISTLKGSQKVEVENENNF
jgi:hypothetical protein